MELVSVIMPTYGRDELIVKRAIDSLTSQTYPQLEIIVVDDNGTEKTAHFRERIRRLTDSYNGKVKLLTNEIQMGGALSRNVGIFAAKGEYITFLDDDDRYLPDKIRKQLEYMNKNGLEMCFTNLRLYNEKERLVDYREFSALRDMNNTTLLQYHLMHNITGTPTFMYRTELLRKIGGFDDVQVGHEYYLMFKTIQAGLKIGYLNGCDVIAYRHKSGGVSYGKTKIIWEKKLNEFKKKHFDILNKKQQRYVLFRHRAVMAVAHIRNKNYFKALGYAILSVLANPAVAVKEVILYFRRIIQQGQKKSS